MKTFTLSLAAIAFATIASTAAFAGSNDHAGDADALAIARGQTYAAPVTITEGRQAVSVSTADNLVLWIATDRDLNSKR